MSFDLIGPDALLQMLNMAKEATARLEADLKVSSQDLEKRSAELEESAAGRQRADERFASLEESSQKLLSAKELLEKKVEQGKLREEEKERQCIELRGKIDVLKERSSSLSIQLAEKLSEQEKERSAAVSAAAQQDLRPRPRRRPGHA